MHPAFLSQNFRLPLSDKRERVHGEVLFLFFLLLFIGPALGADEASPPPVDGGAVATSETDLARQVAEDLTQDPDFRLFLAHRILESSIAKKLTDAGDEDTAIGQIADWILKDPEDAASLRIGFAQDDFNGTHDFEHSLHERVVRYFALNPKREQGLLGVLEVAGSQSKIVQRNAGKLDEEEQRELIKRIFEGKGPEGKRPPLQKQAAGQRLPPTGMGGTAAFAGSGIYDRLSALRPTGYSPEVLALQNALNIQRIPGAPAIPETGKLDYPTLVAPYYSLRYDLGRLNSVLTADGAGMPSAAARRKERQAAIASASRSLREFQQIAEKSKKNSAITSSLLQSLGRQQKETARWITVASLEGDLEHLESLPDHWPEDLLDKIREAPADDSVRQQYLREGQRLLDRLTRIKGADSRTIEALQSSDFLSRWDQAQSELAQVAPLRNRLSQDIALYARLPYLLTGQLRQKPAWRAFIDRWIVRLFPGSSHARRLLREEREWTALQTAFGQVASGEYLQAENSLAKEEV